jgi:hypothetical protein
MSVDFSSLGWHATVFIPTWFVICIISAACLVLGYGSAKLIGLLVR